MNQVSEYVRYGCNGIFHVEDIRKRTGKDGVMADWYILRSHKDGVDTSVMTPVDNELIRPILSKKEISSLIKDMPKIPELLFEDKRQRFHHYQSILESGSVYDLVQMIKSIYLMRLQKEEEGKHLSEKDRELFSFAENLFFEEISISYDIKKDEVMDFIMSRVQES